MTSFQIVTLDPSDWQLFRQIRLEALQSNPEAFSSRFAETAQRPDAHWQQRLEEASMCKGSWLLFAKEEGRLGGMIGAARTEEPGVVEIFSVYVSPEQRGKGVAPALMTAILESVCKRNTFQKAVLGVSADQAAAVALYQRFGFHVVGEQEGVMGDGKPHKGFMMEKALAEGFSPGNR